MQVHRRLDRRQEYNLGKFLFIQALAGVARGGRGGCTCRRNAGVVWRSPAAARGLQGVGNCAIAHTSRGNIARVLIDKEKTFELPLD